MIEGLLKKDKTYTYEELEEIYKEAMAKTVDKPLGDNDKHDEDAHFSFTMMMSSMIILHTMKDNLFGKNKKEED